MSTETTSSNSKGGVSGALEEIGNDFKTVKPLVQLSGLTNIPVGHLAVGGFALVFVCIVFGFFSSWLTAIVGMLYPAYKSFKAIESKEDGDDVQWLTYWVVFSFFHVTDGALSILLQFFPFYYPAKVLFYVYLFYPKTLGATTIFKSLLEPFLLKNQSRIDSALQRGEEAVTKKIFKN